MRDDVEIDNADAIRRTHQIELAIPIEVAKVDRAELAEGDDATDRVPIVGILRGVLRFEASAARIRPARSWCTSNRRLDDLRRRRDDAPVNAGEWNLVAGRQARARSLGEELCICLLKPRYLLAVRLRGRAVIVEMLDWDARGEVL